MLGVELAETELAVDGAAAAGPVEPVEIAGLVALAAAVAAELELELVGELGREHEPVVVQPPKLGGPEHLASGIEASSEAGELAGLDWSLADLRSAVLLSAEPSADAAVELPEHGRPEPEPEPEPEPADVPLTAGPADFEAAAEDEELN